MTNKRSVTLWLQKNLAVNVTGDYFGGYSGSREQPPEEAEFEISKIDLLVGTVNDLLEYLDVLHKETIFEHLAKKSCEKILQEIDEVS